MFVSRSESHQHNKKRKSRRMKRLVIINLSMLVIIGALVIIYFFMNTDGTKKQPDASGTVKQQDNGDAPSGNGANPTKEDDSSKKDADKGEDGSSNPSNKGNENIPDKGTDKGSDNGPNNGPTDNNGTGTNTGTDTENGNNTNNGGNPSVEGESKVTLSFVGDILLAASVDSLMKKNGYEYPYAKALPFLTKPDLMAANLETPITERGVPATNKSFVFKGSPKSLPALKEAGFDIVNLANNHTLDQGVEGLLDTVDYLNKVSMPNIGAGHDDAEAFKPVILEAKGISVAYIGLTRVVPVGSWKAEKDRAGVAETYDATRALKAIREAKQQADLVIVMVHWGIERSDNPNAVQKQLAHAYIDAGADLIVGSHPHVLQGFERYKGKWISYSLGNFIFNMTATDKTKDTGVLDAVCTAKGDCSLQFHPMRAVNSQPNPIEGDQAVQLLKRISSISIQSTLDKNGFIKAKE
ncbi:hypothetical protein Back11_28050 [Paenibacillus baekrokdamisoli]|uniref:Uncharacterized protein n=1 Tax=Paenibacillus baekrokdamisoli TaxID=1712516 RepID=A0A3G9IRH0_9BACL|nr:CapA family protein [Paenibacillus baekrokdamisoli]MBB3071043.1 poly-gamma-glutamate synthesis protein (capsule biosynthesis protein) [Paenibacillus baekrokdamisoli]BBH21460.1 hypothetical protein Back11_28050 [Paenibacillus baekrokdamisoli]